MTRREWHQFAAWFNRNDGELWLCSWFFGLVVGGMIAGVIGDVTNSIAAGFVIGGIAFFWPVALLVLNGAVLFVRYRVDRRLRFERKMQELDARARRISALEGDVDV